MNDNEPVPTAADLGDLPAAWCAVCEATTYLDERGCVACADASDRHRASIKRSRLMRGGRK